MRSFSDRQLAKLIQQAEGRTVVYKFCGVDMLGSKNPDPPEALASEILNLRRTWIRLDKIKSLMVEDTTRDAIDQASALIDSVLSQLEPILDMVLTDWENREQDEV